MRQEAASEHGPPRLPSAQEHPQSDDELSTVVGLAQQTLILHLRSDPCGLLCAECRKGHANRVSLVVAQRTDFCRMQGLAFAKTIDRTKKKTGRDRERGWHLREGRLGAVLCMCVCLLPCPAMPFAARPRATGLC